tara:strand:- start:246 stop:497 length:252 start_codon:yes stop_codon:yes gene_type:complete
MRLDIIWVEPIYNGRSDMTEKMRHILDRGLDKLVSRKLLAWSTATALLLFADLASSDWVIITTVYIGGQTVIDAVTKLKGLGR